MGGLDFPAIPYSDIGVVTLALIVSYLIWSGRLVPIKTVERERANMQRTIDLGDERNRYLETTMSAMQGTKAEVIRQNGELLGTSQLANRLLEAGRVGTQPPGEG